MFDIANSQNIQNNRERLQAQMLGSFQPEPNSQATLIKGISLEEFNSKYSPEAFERYTFSALCKAQDDLMKAEGAEPIEFDDLVKGMSAVVVEDHTRGKKLMYVKPKGSVQ